MTTTAPPHGCSNRAAVLSITTCFCLPHEGMAQLEYLSRGSAFMVDTAASPSSTVPSTLTELAQAADSDRLVVLTAQHVACPGLFPKYFAEKWDWLQHVSEEFVQHSLQLLAWPSAASPLPQVLLELPLQRHVVLHPSRDVAMLVLDGMALTEAVERQSNAIDTALKLRSLALATQPLAPGNDTTFFGHFQLPESTTTENESSPEAPEAASAAAALGQFPKLVTGKFVGQSAHGQAFAWSEEILEEGMCGGAVVDLNGDCVGLIEGIVPPFVAPAPIVLPSDATEEEQEEAAAAAATARMQKALENHVAFVPTDELREFVEDRGSFLPTGSAIAFMQSEDM
ncbi:TPA: hypothetical protein N0F65_005488 [Lagenidium giganteum]|uniref:Uncharacterized protein n=1 Tax=Lagenidium giganteum TaxID=4803 RepID=A0AAV2YH71_9STRA|nr:TPA: hypothetical protein N0F65_005488 [Lagenidium giganteum]